MLYRVLLVVALLSGVSDAKPKKYNTRKYNRHYYASPRNLEAQLATLEAKVKTMDDGCAGAFDVNTHWANVGKSAGGRVTQGDFVDYFKNSGFAAGTTYKSDFTTYLTEVFMVGWGMMPNNEGPVSIGEHCFKAVAALPFAFYRDGPAGGYC